jgi:xanthine dehydrogenase accessory factor
MLHTVFQRAAELTRENRKFALVHMVRIRGSSPGKQGFKMLVSEDGELVGTIGGGDSELQMIRLAHEAMSQGASRSVEYELSSRPGNLVTSLCGGVNEVFIEVFMPKPCLLILGAGHVARAVANLCAMLEYPHVILDDRPDYAVPEHFPGALEVACERGGTYLNRDDLPRFTHVIGLGYNSAFDLDALVPALETLPEDVKFGAIGSRPKYAKMGEQAAQRGISPEQWARVKCPVGIGIGAQTPAELAVSILAEVVASQPGRGSHSWDKQDFERSGAGRPASH